MNLRIPRDFKAKEHDEFDGSYGVYLSGTQIASFAGRSQAKTFAKYLNAALARLGPSQNVGGTDMPSAITSWIADASGSSGSTNGFFPPLTSI